MYCSIQCLQDGWFLFGMNYILEWETQNKISYSNLINLCNLFQDQDLTKGVGDELIFSKLNISCQFSFLPIEPLYLLFFLFIFLLG